MLRQVIAERGEEHVVVAMRAVAGVLGGCAAIAGPDIAADVLIRDALAQTALGAVVEVVPVAADEFRHVLGVAAAVCRSGLVARAAAIGTGELSLDQATGHGRSVGDGSAEARAADTVAGKGVAAGVGAADNEVTINVVAAIVEEDVEARCGIHFHGAERGEGLEGFQGAVGTNGYVSNGRITITAHARAIEALEADGELFIGKGATETAADAAARFHIVVGAAGGGIDAIAVEAADAEGFPVAPTGLDSELGDEVRRNVQGVVGLVVVKSAASAGNTCDVVRGYARTSRVQSLWVLNRHAGPGLLPDVLDHAEAFLARPNETRIVLRVDGGRQ